jgi:hypothetical protein
MARCNGVPRGRRPRARTETPRTGTGRSQVCPGLQLPWDASGSLRTHADDERSWEVGQTLLYLRSPRTTPGNRPRRGWREEAWPKGTCPNKTRPGHRAGTDALNSALERIRQAARRIRRCGSPRSFTTSMRGSVAQGLSQPEERSCARCRRRNLAALRRDPRGQSPGSFP